MKIKQFTKKLLLLSISILAVGLLSPISVSALTTQPALYEYLNTGGDGASDDIYGSNWSAQSFTIGSTSHTLTRISLNLQRTGSPGIVTVSLREGNGSDLPTGIDLASTTLDGDDFDTSYDWYDFDVTEINLEADEEYCIVVRATAGDNSNDVQWRSDTGGGLGSAIGSNSTNSGVSWSLDSPEDYLFEIYGLPCIEVDSVNVYSDYIESGDMLFLCTYKNTYVPYYPTSPASSYFTLQILDTDGSTLLAQVPCKQWEYMPAGIYLSADTAASLTVGSGYYINLYGNFGSNPEDSLQLTSNDWLNGEAFLDDWVLTKAAVLEAYYEDLFGESFPLITYSGGNTVLNETGAAFFSIGIPYLSTIRPDLFQAVEENITHTDTTFTDAFGAAAVWTDMVGTKVVNAATDTAVIIGADAKTGVVIIMLMLYLVIAVVLFRAGHTTAGLVLSFPVILAAGVLRVIDFALVAIILSLAVFVAIRSYWWSRT